MLKMIKLRQTILIGIFACCLSTEIALGMEAAPNDQEANALNTALMSWTCRCGWDINDILTNTVCKKCHKAAPEDIYLERLNCFRKSGIWRCQKCIKQGREIRDIPEKLNYLALYTSCQICGEHKPTGMISQDSAMKEAREALLNRRKLKKDTTPTSKPAITSTVSTENKPSLPSIQEVLDENGFIMESKCTICLEGLSTKKIVVGLTCKHVFCKECKDAISQKNVCPTCNKELEEKKVFEKGEDYQ